MPPRTLDSLHLYHTALSSLSLPIPPSPSPPPPSLPPSKHIPKTGFLVDSFRSPCPPSFAYFLSHFHSDHYSGLSPGWSLGLIFSSPITSRLLVNILKIPHQFVFPLPLCEPVIIDGVEVTLIDANHCPGAVQFLFRVPGKIPKTYVHSGDFRYCSKMREDDILKSFAGCDAVFLDTTYCNPKFVFPSQEESVDYVVSVIESVEREVRGLERAVLFLVATYVVGKEKILLEIARRCGRKVHVDRRKMEVLRVLGYGESGVFTEDERESDVHVVGWNVLGETWPYFRPNFSGMKEIMDERGYSRVVGFVPTGWTYEVKRNKFAVRSKDSFEIHLVPYSEHSNYNELREYVKFLRPKHVIPTVGIDVEKLDSKHADKMRKHFVGLVDEMANKKEFFMAFLRGSSVNDEKVEMDVVSDSKEDLDQGKEVKSSETERIEGNVQDAVLNSSTTLQEPVSENLCAVSDDEAEKVVQELKDSLPAWVTREQLLGLISSSGWNVVEAVSSFYECETEFHEQVFTHGTSLSASETGARGSELLNKPVSPKRSHESFSFPLSQNYKSPRAKPSVKRGISHGKTKRDSNNKSGKKAKINLKPESGGSKQSTITKFFSKVLTNISQGSTIGITSEESPTVAIPMVDDDAKLYAGEIYQFIKIIGGNESSESYAAMMLKRTNGDINKALDMHYGNPEADLLDSVGQSLGSRNLVQIQPSANDCPSVRENTVREEAQLAVDLSVTGLSTHNVDATLVSLPLEKYNPVEHACWVAGQPAPYIHLARTFDLVEAEKGKIKATSMLCNMFRSLLALAPEDVLPAVYLCTNKIAANYENVELNIGGSLVTSALEEACGTTRSRIREMYNNFGDLGDVAQLCRQTQKLLASPPPLLIRDVLSVLRKISVQAGSRSTSRKKSLIVNLIRSCREKEVKFIIRTLVRNLRIGAMMRTVLPALAQAVGMHFYDNCFEGGPKDLKEKLKYLSAAAVEAYNIVPNLDMVVPSLLNKGFEFSSSTLSMVPGIPIKPMLAKITNGVPEVLDILQNKAFTCEYKYDGQRAQIHRLPDGSVRIFSRNGDETTSRFPDLINIIEESCKHAAATFIVDAEVVAIDRRNGCNLMSFQELSSRERGSKDSTVTMANIKVDICVFVFDIMFAHGEKLLELPLRQRRKYLKELFCDKKLGYLEFAKEITIEADDACLTNEETITKINTFLEYALHSSCEGIMVKSLDVDAEYCPSKRTDTWLKVKRDYVDGLNDSLDLVPIGAWHGNGRKAGWYSPFLMACYSPETEEFQSVCRVMSGFSDIFYAEMKEYFSEDRILSKKPPYYRTAEVPDMWFSPSLVWAIRGADFSVSPVHQAAVGLVHPTRGISMRFPRFVQSVCDRSPEECSTAADIADMFNSQTRKMSVTAPT